LQWRQKILAKKSSEKKEKIKEKQDKIKVWLWLCNILLLCTRAVYTCYTDAIPQFFFSWYWRWIKIFWWLYSIVNLQLATLQLATLQLATLHFDTTTTHLY
jgi:hypothetical protein